MRKETAKQGALPVPKAIISEKRGGRVWGHGAPMVAEDEGSPREAKDSGAVCQWMSVGVVWEHPPFVGAEGGQGGSEKRGCGIRRIWRSRHKLERKRLGKQYLQR